MTPRRSSRRSTSAARAPRALVDGSHTNASNRCASSGALDATALSAHRTALALQSHASTVALGLAASTGSAEDPLPHPTSRTQPTSRSAGNSARRYRRSLKNTPESCVPWKSSHARACASDVVGVAPSSSPGGPRRLVPTRPTVAAPSSAVTDGLGAGPPPTAGSHVSSTSLA